jgi:hypothetical protein
MFEPKEILMSASDSVADYESEQLYRAGETKASGRIERGFSGATN